MTQGNTQAGEIARVTIGDVRPFLERLHGALEDIVAANDKPPPQPGFRRADERLFYVTQRGRSYLVRDELGCVQLTPAAVPDEARACGDQADDDVNAVADAADFVDERAGGGVYHDGRYFYFLAGDSVWMLYGTAHFPVRVPCLPPGAAVVDVPPADVAAVILRMQETG